MPVVLLSNRFTGYTAPIQQPMGDVGSNELNSQQAIAQRERSESLASLPAGSATDGLIDPFARVERLIRPDDMSPLVKQVPIAALFFAAALLSSSISTLTVSSWPALATGGLLIVAATLLGAVFSRPSLARFATIVPAADFLAAGLLRHGTGDSRSIYASLVLLPVLWFSAMEGRRYILYAVLGAVVAILVPFALGASTDENPTSCSGACIASLFSPWPQLSSTN